MLELHISETDVSSGSIPISWCVSKDVLDLMVINNVKDPQIVIVIAPEENYHYKKEHRVVVSMNDMIAYIPFKCVGKNKIFAFLTEDKKYTRNRYLHKDNGEYDTNILDGDGINYYDRVGGLVGSLYNRPSDEDYTNYQSIIKEKYFAQPLSVNVPKEAFADPVSSFDLNWVNWLASDKYIDQCNFRRRRLFAYTVQPFILLSKIIMTTIFTIWSLLIGHRGFSFRPLLHPLCDMQDITNLISGGSYFWKDTHRPAKDIIRVLGTPILWIVVGICGYLHLFHFLLLVCLVMLGALFIAALMVLVPMLGKDIFQSLDQKLIENEKKRKDKKLWYKNQENIDLLICNGQKKPLKVSQLPRSHRTISLRYQDLKSKVCKPFSL